MIYAICDKRILDALREKQEQIELPQGKTVWKTMEDAEKFMLKFKKAMSFSPETLEKNELDIIQIDADWDTDTTNNSRGSTVLKRAAKIIMIN